MTISVKVRDFRGCERADIEVAPIALVAGLNGAAKSSIAQATGAALYGNALPLAGLSRAGAGALVRAGASGSLVEVRGDAGWTRIEWPACATRSEGTPPRSSEFGAGLTSIPLIDKPEHRARIMAEYLKAAPTRDDLAAALADSDLSAPPVVDAVWKLIEDQGWDAAYQLRKERGAELKGRWRQLTAVNYGSRIAASWRPDLADELLSEAELIALVDEARAAHERAISVAAVAAVDRERLQAEAAELDARTAALVGAEAEIERRQAALTAAQAARAALPPTHDGSDPELPCPHCGAYVIIRQVSLVERRLEAAPPKPDQAELRNRRQAVAEAEGKLANATDGLNTARRMAADARKAVEAATVALQRLDALPASTAAGGDAEAAKQTLARAEKRLQSYRTKRDADDVHAKVVGNELILELLAGDGLRGRKLARVIDLFNTGQLRPLCDAAAWRPVTIEPDMSVAYGGRPYPLLSSSEQYRVRVVLQLAMAALDGSDMVVLDAADILDAPTRSGLFALLDFAKIAAIVCMTLSRRDQVPNLESMGAGRSYWLQDGIATPLTVEKAAA
jgi:hypothetical protein